jgi:hypothetical protein
LASEAIKTSSKSQIACASFLCNAPAMRAVTRCRHWRLHHCEPPRAAEIGDYIIASPRSLLSLGIHKQILIGTPIYIPTRDSSRYLMDSITSCVTEVMTNSFKEFGEGNVRFRSHEGLK